jgi:hypothetical protein
MARPNATTKWTRYFINLSVAAGAGLPNPARRAIDAEYQPARPTQSSPEDFAAADSGLESSLD